MNVYPLIFGLPETVTAVAFQAQVQIHGRALLRLEDGEVLIEGINPSGFAGCGETIAEAMSDFRTTLREVLADIAHNASFDAFRAEALRFFNDAPPGQVAEWDQARLLVRQTQRSEFGLKLDPAPKFEIKITRARPHVVPRELPLQMAA